MSDWQEHLANEPMHGPHWDLRFGALLALVANKLRPEGAPLFHPHDFFPSIEKPPPRQMTAEEMLANATAWTLAMGGTVIESDGSKRGQHRLPT